MNEETYSPMAAIFAAMKPCEVGKPRTADEIKRIKEKEVDIPLCSVVFDKSAGVYAVESPPKNLHDRAREVMFGDEEDGVGLEREKLRTQERITNES